jgi:DNA-binding NarL/FixJ family response regulator
MNKLGKAAAIRVLIADDHPVVREGLAAMINRRPDMTVVAEARNGREAVGLFRQHRPDVALIDLRMPEMDGVSAILAIREQFPPAQTIILTTYDGDEDIYRGLQAGAKAYLLKDASREELFECIRAVHEGRTYLSPAIAAKLAEHMHSAALTSRELEVLRLLSEGRSNKEIGTTLSITEGTVKLHVNNILGKLGVSSRTEAVTVALKRGILRLK